MALTRNGSKVENATRNGSALSKVTVNGKAVWRYLTEIIKSSSVKKSGTVTTNIPTEQLTTNVSVTLNGNVITFGKDNTVCAGVFWLVDMTEYSELTINAVFNIGKSAWAYPNIRDKSMKLVKSYTEVGSDSSATTKTINTTFDCSGLTGEHYVGFYFWGGGGQQGGTITVKDLVVK